MMIYGFIYRHVPQSVGLIRLKLWPEVPILVPAGATLVVSALLMRRWWRSRKEPPSFKMGLPVIGAELHLKELKIL